MNPSTDSTTSVPDEDVTTEATATVEAPAPAALVEQDLLVEDVSIDGMCGVY
ncbi:mycofactocin precursor MftA [Patulibacter sp.]|uniref:mycofactocin precursor MftA n=1 Tax=Patulibacter sp. TaxID=1912859 RepID=UPI00271F40D6|nr:mycofactocin precursor MftA [Patulibacter sp.]MDO9407927.1 mycofactocin precursor MftA [Patulibacter sp.]